MLIFDTLQYAKRAKEVGFTEAQAEFQAEEIAKVVGDQANVINDQMATKADLESVRDELKNEIEGSKKDLKIWFGTMLSIAVTVLGILVSILHR